MKEIRRKLAKGIRLGMCGVFLLGGVLMVIFGILLPGDAGWLLVPGGFVTAAGGLLASFFG